MIRLETRGAFPVVCVDGVIGLSDVTELQQSFDALDAEPIVILSLESATFVDPSVVALLRRQHAAYDGNFVIVVRALGPLAQLFATAGLPHALRIVSDRNEADALAANLRDVSAGSFSRDGVAHVRPGV